MMAEQIAHRDAVGRNGVVEAEFRDVIADRILPIQALLVHQKGQARGGERLRDRADHEMGVGRHRQAGFDITKAIGLDQRRLAVLHHRDGETRNFPLVHRFRDESFEVGNEGRNGFARRDRSGCHRRDSSTGAMKSRAASGARNDGLSRSSTRPTRRRAGRLILVVLCPASKPKEHRTGWSGHFGSGVSDPWSIGGRMAGSIQDGSN